MELKLASSVDEYFFLYETRTNPKIDKMLSGKPPKDYDSHYNYVKNVQQKTRWIYILYNQDVMVGYSQIYDITEDSCEVGFAISPGYQGKGFGKEIVRLTIEKAKETFENKKVVLYVLKSNSVARNIYFKIGFREKILKNSTDELIGMVLEK